MELQGAATYIYIYIERERERERETHREEKNRGDRAWGCRGRRRSIAASVGLFGSSGARRASRASSRFGV